MAESDDDKLVRLIEEAVRRHEIKVAWWSGVFGAALLAGIFHAIALLNHELSQWTAH